MRCLVVRGVRCQVWSKLPNTQYLTAVRVATPQEFS